MARVVATNDEDEDTSSVVKATVRNKTKTGGPRLVLMEESDADAEDDEDVPHSGVVRNGINIYDESPVRGGRMLTSKGVLINHKGHEIEEDGTVIDPDRYKEDQAFNQ